MNTVARPALRRHAGRGRGQPEQLSLHRGHAACSRPVEQRAARHTRGARGRAPRPRAHRRWRCACPAPSVAERRAVIARSPSQAALPHGKQCASFAVRSHVAATLASLVLGAAGAWVGARASRPCLWVRRAGTTPLRAGQCGRASLETKLAPLLVDYNAREMCPLNVAMNDCKLYNFLKKIGWSSKTKT